MIAIFGWLMAAGLVLFVAQMFWAATTRQICEPCMWASAGLAAVGAIGLIVSIIVWVIAS